MTCSRVQDLPLCRVCSTRFPHPSIQMPLAGSSMMIRLPYHRPLFLTNLTTLMIILSYQQTAKSSLVQSATLLTLTSRWPTSEMELTSMSSLFLSRRTAADSLCQCILQRHHIRQPQSPNSLHRSLFWRSCQQCHHLRGQHESPYPTT